MLGWLAFLNQVGQVNICAKFQLSSWSRSCLKVYGVNVAAEEGNYCSKWLLSLTQRSCFWVALSWDELSWVMLGFDNFRVYGAPCIRFFMLLWNAETWIAKTRDFRWFCMLIKKLWTHNSRCFFSKIHSKCLILESAIYIQPIDCVM